MKLTTTNRNQHGFIHYIVPALVFVVLFGAVGTIVFLRAKAATPTYYIESTVVKSIKGTSECLTNLSGSAKLEACSTYKPVATFLNSGGETQIKISGQCLANSGNGQPTADATFSAAACKGGISADYFAILYPRIESANISPATCLGATGINGKVALHSCNSAYYASWRQVAVSSTPAPSPNPPPPPSPNPKVNLNATPTTCYKNLYTTQDVNTFSNCVGALQTMLNGMDHYDHGSSISVDGYYGNNTADAVYNYQVYQNDKTHIAQDHEAGMQTWHYLCWSIHNRNLNTGTGNSAKAFKYAECSQDDSTPPGK